MGNSFSGVKIEDLDYFDALVTVFRKEEKKLQKTQDRKDKQRIFNDIKTEMKENKIIKKGKKAYDYYSARPDIVPMERKKNYLDKFEELEKNFQKAFKHI